MKKTFKNLLFIDGIVNLLLGVLLLLFPLGIAPSLGIPVPDTHFYPTILGAVLLGIGIALLIDVLGQPHGHAELSSLRTFAKKLKLDLTKSMKLLDQAGYPVEDSMITFMRSLKTSPKAEDVFQ